MSVSGARVNVTGTATALFTADADASSVLVRNKDAAEIVALGASTVTYAAGFRLAAGESVSLDLAAGEVLYAISDGTTVECDVLRAGVG